MYIYIYCELPLVYLDVPGFSPSLAEFCQSSNYITIPRTFLWKCFELGLHAEDVLAQESLGVGRGHVVSHLLLVAGTTFPLDQGIQPFVPDVLPAQPIWTQLQFQLSRSWGIGGKTDRVRRSDQVSLEFIWNWHCNYKIIIIDQTSSILEVLPFTYIYICIYIYTSFYISIYT